MWARTGWSVEASPFATMRHSRTWRRIPTRLLLTRVPAFGIETKHHYNTQRVLILRGRTSVPGIPVSRIECESRRADSNILSSAGQGSAVADPNAFGRHHGLPRIHVQIAG